MSIMTKKLVKNISIFSIATIISILSSTISARASEMSYEEKIEKIKSNYSRENLEFIDGIILKQGEVINIEKYLSSQFNGEIKEFVSQDESILSINNFEVTAKKSGTTFIIVKGNNKNFVIEVGVSDNTNTYSVKNKSVSIDRDYYKVFIDPGHGGADPGSLGNGLRETDLNLIISKKVKEKLEDRNIKVEMSREKEETVSLLERAKMANRYDADAFISIHQNSFSSAGAYGIETYYHNNKVQYKPFATEIQRKIINNTKGYNRGVKSANFAVIRESNMTSALIECGFISNPSEASKLRQDSYQEKIATGIADAVTLYLKENVKLQPKPQEPGVFYDTVNHWAKSSIKQFVTKGYMEGYKDGSFKPDKSITRAEFIKIVNKSFNFNSQATENFSDVNSEDWFYGEVKTAVKAGYIDIKNNKFRPNDAITREEVAAIITTIKNNKDGNLDKLNTYLDKDKVSQWAKSSVEGAIEVGYMGKDSKNFRPKDNITRAEAVVTLERIN